MDQDVRVFDTGPHNDEPLPAANIDGADKRETTHQHARLGVDIAKRGFCTVKPWWNHESYGPTGCDWPGMESPPCWYLKQGGVGGTT